MIQIIDDYLKCFPAAETRVGNLFRYLSYDSGGAIQTTKKNVGKNTLGKYAHSIAEW